MRLQGLRKSRLNNLSKIAAVVSITCSQLLPINQSAYGAGETSSTFLIPKSTSSAAKIRVKVPVKINAAEPTMLSWQTFLNPNSSRADLNKPYDECNLTSSNGKKFNHAFNSSGSTDAVYVTPLDGAYFVFKSPVSTNLILDCRYDSILSEGTLKLSKYILNSTDLDNLPAKSEFEIKSGEVKVLIFNLAAGTRSYFSIDSDKSGRCVLSSISDSANPNPHLANWDIQSRPRDEVFGGLDYRGAKVSRAVKFYTAKATGIFMMTCMLDERAAGTVIIETVDQQLKILRPLAATSEAVTTNKCPEGKAPSKAPKISVAPNGLFIQYSETGLSDLSGCIDGFRVYAQTLNPYSKEVVQQNGAYSIQIKDCEKRDKGLISCLIPNKEPWLQTLNSQDASSKALAVNAVAVNSNGESEASPYSFLFEKESALISAACISMQTTFSNNMIFKTPIAYVVGVGVGLTAGAIVSVISGGIATPFVVAAGTSIVAASVSKPVSERISASIDKKAAKKFVETYPVTALELLISMKKSSNPDVRAKSETIQKAIQASDLMKIYQPLIGENSSLTDFELAKILGDEKLSRIKTQEISKFEKNGANDVKTLFAKNPNIQINLIKGASQGADVYMNIREQNQNNKSAIELVLPKNCNY